MDYLLMIAAWIVCMGFSFTFGNLKGYHEGYDAGKGMETLLREKKTAREKIAADKKARRAAKKELDTTDGT